MVQGICAHLSISCSLHLLSSVKAWSSLKALHFPWVVVVHLSPWPLPAGLDLSQTLGLHIPAKVLGFVHWSVLHSCWLCCSDLASPFCVCFLPGKPFLTSAACVCCMCLLHATLFNISRPHHGKLYRGFPKGGTSVVALWLDSCGEYSKQGWMFGVS